LGIGRPPGSKGAAAYVLQRFGDDEQDILHLVLERAEGAVRVFLRAGLEAAMNLYNGSPQEK